MAAAQGRCMEGERGGGCCVWVTNWWSPGASDAVVFAGSYCFTRLSSALVNQQLHSQHCNTSKACGVFAPVSRVLSPGMGRRGGWRREGSAVAVGAGMVFPKVH